MASTEVNTPRPRTHESTRTAPRRPYASPRVLYTETLEAVAADCSVPGGKGDPTCLIGFS